MFQALDMSDLTNAVSTAFTGYDEAVLGLAGVGVGIALVLWGVPKAVGFVKRVAR